MKRLFLFILGLSVFNTKAQQAPTGNVPANTTLAQANAAWYRGGNNLGTIPNNIFGTRWNSGIYTITDNQFRMKLNGTTSYTYNGYAGVRNGYLLLGQAIGGNYTGVGPNTGAASLLHLNGTFNSTSQPFLGYRPWMQTGVTFSDNDDLSYFGMRRVNNTTDLTETTICWSNDGGGNFGPDDMVFRFLSGGGVLPNGFPNPNGNTINNNLVLDDDLDGRHVARFTNDGLMGLGNTFGVNGLNNIGGPYVRPQSLLHMSYSNSQSIWSQYTNRDGTNATGGINGTGERDIDGLRIGILGSNNALINGTAAIYNQELRPILMSTNANSTTINPATGATGERVRITSVSTPTNLPTGGPMAAYNPGSLPGNLSRVSISHNPSNPVTRPLSLLHIGYNAGLNSFVPGATDGWRSWMDIGTFTNDGSDNIYVGLKRESTDRSDAVVNWGDNQNGGSIGNLGPDNLRFIFTSTTTGLPSGDAKSISQNGLEVARMAPTKASTLPITNFGMMGIGDFSPGSPNNGITAGVINYIDAKLDIDGDLRIRTVTPDNNLTQVLVIDPTDKNRVHYRNIPLGGGSGSGQGFFDCTNQTTAPNLTSDSKINLNDNNLYFENNGILGENHIGIGYNCAVNLRAKLSVQQTHPQNVNQSTIGISGLNRDVSTVLNRTFTGVEGAAIGVQTQPKVINRGGYFGALNAQETRGVVAEVQASPNNTSSAFGGEFIVSAVANDNRGVSVSCTGNGGNGITTNTGVFGNAANSSLNNSGGVFIGSSANNTNAVAIGVSAAASGSATRNIGGDFRVIPNYNAVNIATSGHLASPINAYTYPVNVAIGVYGYANTNPTTEYAGFFDGDVWINGPANSTGFAVTTSDQNFKTDVHLISNADSILSQLQPKTFYFDTLNPYGFNFSNQLQYGLLAQEVELILPELVTNQYKPATVDSTGTIVTQGVDYKALNYDAFISILISGHKEQKQKIDSLQNGIDNRDSIINNLNDRLTHLENCLSGILPFLCQISNSTIQPTQEVFQEQLKNEINVQLSNKNTIILNQNVPNPFAEQTQISFSIPETVKKAQIHFYDANGKLINSVEVEERGLGQLNVFANDLSTGVYTYTLVADGQIVATKKMMKQ
jgi:hypothetical protein